MADQDTNDIFKLKMKAPQSKAEITDSTVRDILRTEADAHDSLTQRLRQARLERDAAAKKAAPKASAKAAPAKRRSRAKPKG